MDKENKLYNILQGLHDSQLISDIDNSTCRGGYLLKVKPEVALKTILTEGGYENIDEYTANMYPKELLIGYEGELISYIEIAGEPKKLTKKHKDRLEVLNKLPVYTYTLCNSSDVACYRVATGEPIVYDTQKDKEDKGWAVKDDGVLNYFTDYVRNKSLKKSLGKSRKFGGLDYLAKEMYNSISIGNMEPERKILLCFEMLAFKMLSDRGLIRGFPDFTEIYLGLQQKPKNEVPEAACVCMEKYKNSRRYLDLVITDEGHHKGLSFGEEWFDVRKYPKLKGGYSWEINPEEVNTFLALIATVQKYNLLWGDMSKLTEYDLLEYTNAIFSYAEIPVSEEYFPETVLDYCMDIASLGAKGKSFNVGIPLMGSGKSLLSLYKESDNTKRSEIIYGTDLVEPNDMYKKAMYLVYMLGSTSQLNTDIESNMAIYSDILNKVRLGTKFGLGYLRSSIKFDLVIASIPEGNPNDLEEVDLSGKGYELDNTTYTAFFVEWLLNSLKVGGSAILVVPPEFYSDDMYKSHRSLLLSTCNVISVINIKNNEGKGALSVLHIQKERTVSAVSRGKLGYSVSNKECVYLEVQLEEVEDIFAFKSVYVDYLFACSDVASLREEELDKLKKVDGCDVLDFTEFDGGAEWEFPEDAVEIVETKPLKSVPNTKLAETVSAINEKITPENAPVGIQEYKTLLFDIGLLALECVKEVELWDI